MLAAIARNIHTNRVAPEQYFVLKHATTILAINKIRQQTTRIIPCIVVLSTIINPNKARATEYNHNFIRQVYLYYQYFEARLLYIF